LRVEGEADISREYESDEDGSDSAARESSCEESSLSSFDDGEMCSDHCPSEDEDSDSAEEGHHRQGGPKALRRPLGGISSKDTLSQA
jgi:hypothetical protein